MARNSSVMRIFWRSSGILKIVTSLRDADDDAGRSEQAEAVAMRTVHRDRATARSGGHARTGQASHRIATSVGSRLSSVRSPSRLSRLRSPWRLRLHLVADRLLRRRDQLRTCRPWPSIFSAADFEKWWALTVSFLVSSPLPRMRTPSAGAVGQPLRLQRGHVDACRRRRTLVEVADVDDVVVFCPRWRG